MLRRHIVSTVVWSALIITGEYSPCLADQARVEKVLKMWKDRRQQSTTAHASIQGTQVIPKGTRTVVPTHITRANGDANRQVPTEDLRDVVNAECVLDFAGARAFFAVTRPVQDTWTGEFVSFREVFGYDRDIAFLITRNEVRDAGKVPNGLIHRQVNIESREAREHAEHIRRFCWPILFAHGIVLTADVQDVAYGLEAVPLSPPMFHCTPIPSLSGDGAEVLLLRSVPSASDSRNATDIIVDPNRDGAILRLLSTSEGNPFFSFDIDYDRIHDRWLPTHWVLREFRPTKQMLISSFDVSVTSYEVGQTIDSALFVPVIQEGDLIKDARNNKREVRTSTGDIPLRQVERYGLPRNYAVTYYVIIGAFVAIAIYVGWRWARRE